MKGHLSVHWPTVTKGHVADHRPEMLDEALQLVSQEIADTWERYCRIEGVFDGNGLARVVIVVDVAPESHGGIERRKVRFQ